jgi:hypothetical protein
MPEQELNCVAQKQGTPTMWRLKEATQRTIDCPFAAPGSSGPKGFARCAKPTPPLQHRLQFSEGNNFLQETLYQTCALGRSMQNSGQGKLVSLLFWYL